MIHLDREKLLQLSPQAFENLVFDLVRQGEIQNLIWRTPGADGGRDLEGVTFDQDASGTIRPAKWYIECKRYSSSVGWPTVWEKVAYGDAAQADFVLLATTTTFTPRCIEEVDKWNNQHRRPAVRLWPLSELEFRLQLAAPVAVKYGLVQSSNAPATALAGLALEVARMAQAVSGAQATMQPAEAYSRALMDLAQLLYVRSVDLDQGIRLTRAPFQSTDKWPEIADVEGQPFPALDRNGFYAFAGVLGVLLRHPLSLLSVSEKHCRFEVQDADIRRLTAADKLIRIVSNWGLFTVELKGRELWLTNQTLT